MIFAACPAWRRTPQEAPRSSVVISASNESERIVPTIASIAAHLCASDFSFDIVVSDDGSNDGTRRLCCEPVLWNLVVLDPGVDQGKGGRSSGRSWWSGSAARAVSRR